MTSRLRQPLRNRIDVLDGERIARADHLAVDGEFGMEHHALHNQLKRITRLVLRKLDLALVHGLSTILVFAGQRTLRLAVCVLRPICRSLVRTELRVRERAWQTHHARDALARHAPFAREALHDIRTCCSKRGHHGHRRKNQFNAKHGILFRNIPAIKKHLFLLC